MKLILCNKAREIAAACNVNQWRMADLECLHLDTGDVVVALESEQEPAQLALHTQNDVSLAVITLQTL